MRSSRQLCSLSRAIHDRNQFLVTVSGCSHDDQQALLLVFRVFQPNIDVDAIRPQVDILLAREIATIPFLVLARPFSLSRTITFGLNPLAFSPSSDCKASEKSPVEMPLR